MSKFADLLKISKEVEQQKAQIQEERRQEELRLMARQNALHQQLITIYEDVSRDFIRGFKSFLGLSVHSDYVAYHFHTHSGYGLEYDEVVQKILAGQDVQEFINIELTICLNLNGKKVEKPVFIFLEHLPATKMLKIFYSMNPSNKSIVELFGCRRIEADGKELCTLNMDVNSEEVGMRQDGDWQAIFEQLFVAFQKKLHD